MLPDDCCWKGTLHSDTQWFYVGELSVGMVSLRVDGRWYALVNRHLDPGRWRKAFCSRPEVGKRWVERWALARIDRFRAEQPPDAALGVTPNRD